MNTISTDNYGRVVVIKSTAKTVEIDIILYKICRLLNVVHRKDKLFVIR